MEYSSNPVSFGGWDPFSQVMRDPAALCQVMVGQEGPVDGVLMEEMVKGAVQGAGWLPKEGIVVSQ